MNRQKRKPVNWNMEGGSFDMDMPDETLPETKVDTWIDQDIIDGFSGVRTCIHCGSETFWYSAVVRDVAGDIEIHEQADTAICGGRGCPVTGSTDSFYISHDAARKEPMTTGQ